MQIIPVRCGMARPRGRLRHRFFLGGGYSQFQYLHPRSILHRVPAGVEPRLAAMALPIGNGFQWTVLDGHAGPG